MSDPLPTVPLTLFVADAGSVAAPELGAVLFSDSANADTPAFKLDDGSLINVTDGVRFAPSGNGDDWPQLNALMTANAYKRPIVFAPGTYTCDTPGLVPSGTMLVMSPGVLIESTLDAEGNQSQCVFRAFGVYSEVSTTLSVDGIAGTSTVAVASITSPEIALGTEISISDNTSRLATQIYRVVAMGGTDNLTLTLDRAMLEPWPSATSVVRTVSSRPRDIKIFGNGAVVVGSGDRVVEIGAALRCVVDDLHLEYEGGPGFTDMGFAWDVGSRDCRFSNCSAVGAGSGSTYGFACESNEGSVIVNCRTSRWNIGQLLLDSWDCAIINAHSSRCHGYGANLNGSRGCRIAGGIFSDCPDGILVINSHGSAITGVECLGSLPSHGGLQISGAHTVDTRVDGSYFHDNSNGIVVAAGPAQTKLIGCTFRNNTNTDFNCPGDAIIDGFTSVGAGAFAIFLSGGAGTAWVVDNAEIETTTAAAATGIYVAGGAGATLSVSNTTIKNGAAGGICVRAAAAGTVIMLQNVAGTGVTSGSYGVYASAAGVVRRSGRVDFESFATPYHPTLVRSWGTVQLNGTTPVEVAFGDLLANEYPRLTLVSRGGTYGGPPDVALTPGTKFTLTGQASDTSTYAWQVG